ncbi:MAG: OmpA family protein [Cyclobacteriaceae bacterium]|nr:OmpA family protein [Cyclobacteriaceae bacterium]
MHRIATLLFLLNLFQSVFLRAQTVQWASEVLDFSTELTPVQYSAQQILGKPNVLPAGGENPGAWTPDRANNNEFIKVGFINPMSIQQIAIAESYNPSTITNVYTYDEAGNEYLVHAFSPGSVPIQSRVRNVFMETTTYKVAAVKLEFDGASVPEYYSIDAIAITDSNIPIVAEIDIPQALNDGIVIERLSDNVNSEYKEYKPLLSPDGEVLYFSRKNHPENTGGIEDDEDIWYSEKHPETGEWMKAKNIGSILNNEGPNFVSSITPDGKSVVLLLGNTFMENGKMAAGVSVSTKQNGEWTKPKKLEIKNEYNYSDKSYFYLNNSRKVLLMSVMREDTKGGLDMYVSFLEDDSTWTEPLNIGADVNTAGDEVSPFMAADDQTLYFSSNGYSGFGGSDVFAVKRLDDTWTKWSNPENMGNTINSEYEDLFFYIPVKSDKAYYSRGVSADDVDIYSVDLPLYVMPEQIVSVKGQLLDAKTGEPISAKIIYERLSDGKELGISLSDSSTGNYELLLPAGEIYGIRAEANGYISENQNLDLTNWKDGDKKIDHEDFSLKSIDDEDKPLEKDLELVPIEKDAVVTLNNVFFDFDNADLKSESKPELNRLVETLTTRSTMIIEVDGHTDSTGSEDYNLILSERRAKAVANYLIQQGVDTDRVIVKYFGESQPVTTNSTQESRRKNRRVEFKIMNE